jgi:cytochrome c-type biogenesis protein CcmH
VIRRFVPWAALAAVVAVTLAVVLWPEGGDTSPRARARALAEELRCPECQGLAVADSVAPTARAMRADIRDRIAAGESDAEIRQAMIDRFGESVLLNPESDGIGLVVWALPVIAVVVGAGGLGLALWRWRRQPRAQASDADEALVERART